MKNKITMNSSSIIVLLITMILCTIYLCFMIKYKKKSYRKCYENFNLETDNSCRSRFTICSTGSYCPPGSIITTQCSSGYYCPNTSTQVICSGTGSYCPSGSITETLCSMGNYCPNSYTQNVCDKGYYCPQGSVSQTKCASGYYCPNTSSQIKCDQGFYCPGSEYQYYCMAGYYCPDPSIQIPCDPGYLCFNEYGRGPETPKDCPSGYYCSNPYYPTQCSTGYYCPIRSSSYNLCASGYYCPNPSLQIECSTGYYCQQGSIIQTLCSEGFYCPNALSQIRCSTGSYCPQGSTNERNYLFQFVQKGNFVKQWTNICLSGNGQYQTATENSSSIYSSADYGETWTNIFVNDTPRSIVMSNSGQYRIFSTTFYVYVSSNYGSIWNQKISYSQPAAPDLAISSDGKYQIAIGPNGVKYESNDFGSTWTGPNTIWSGIPSTKFPHKIAISSDGNYQLVAVSLSSEPLYLSVDKGNNWRVVSLSLTYAGNIWYGVSVSSSGKYQIGFQYNEYIIFSSDFGNNWIRIIISIGYSLRSSSISSTGQYIILSTTRYLYGSKDYGNTWNIIDNNLSWNKVSISADGIYSGAILSASSKIYISNSIS